MRSSLLRSRLPTRGSPPSGKCKNRHSMDRWIHDPLKTTKNYIDLSKVYSKQRVMKWRICLCSLILVSLGLSRGANASDAVPTFRRGTARPVFSWQHESLPIGEIPRWRNGRAIPPPTIFAPDSTTGDGTHVRIHCREEVTRPPSGMAE